MAKVRVAILGQGRSGRDIHGYALQKMSDKFEIVAVADGLADRRHRAEAEFGCRTYRDYQELLQDGNFDLVVNSLPSLLHVPVSLEFLNRGFHVLCEKPLARKVSDVDLLLRAAREKGKILAIFQQSRFSPAFTKIREVIDSGRLGRIVQVSISFSGFARRWDWQTLKAMNGGNLLNTGPHPVDQALQLFGTDVMPEVFCRMDSANSYGDAEDYVKLVLHGENHPVVDVEISSCSAYPAFTYQIQGTRGGLSGNTAELKWRYFREEEAAGQVVTRQPLEQEDGTPAYCSEQLEWHEEHWELGGEAKENLFYAMSHAFYDMLHASLTTNAPLVVKPDEVRQQVAVIEECFRQNPRFAL